MQEHNFHFIWRVAGCRFLIRWVPFEHFMISQALLWVNDCWAGLASYQDFCCRAEQIDQWRDVEAKGIWVAAFAASHLWRDKRCPQNDPIPVSCGSTTARA